MGVEHVVASVGGVHGAVSVPHRGGREPASNVEDPRRCQDVQDGDDDHDQKPEPQERQ